MREGVQFDKPLKFKTVDCILGFPVGVIMTDTMSTECEKLHGVTTEDTSRTHLKF